MTKKIIIGLLTWIILAIFLHVTLSYFVQEKFSSESKVVECVLSVAMILTYPGFLFATNVWPGVHENQLLWQTTIEVFNDIFYFLIITILFLKFRKRSGNKSSKSEN